MNNLVFFWVGEDISIPEYFVKSIKKINSKIEITQVSDLKTNKINGVHSFISSDLPKDIMLARLKAYSLIETKYSNTIFCDADTLMIKEFNFLEFKKGYYIMRRKNNNLINHMWPEHYPEFKDKFFLDIMPFLFGAIIISKKDNFFLNLFNICKKLPTRFHRWYGDQLSLHIYYLDNKKKFSFFDQEKNMYILDFKDKSENQFINQLRRKGISFITFKGYESKKRIKDFYNYISEMEDI